MERVPVVRSKSKSSKKKTGDVVARLALTQGHKRSTTEFDSVEVAPGEDGFIVVTMRNATGEEVIVEFARAHAKKLVSWRLLAGL